MSREPVTAAEQSGYDDLWARVHARIARRRRNRRIAAATFGGLLVAVLLATTWTRTDWLRP